LAKQRKKNNGGDFEELDEWKDEFMFLREEFDNIRHKQNQRFCCAEDCVFLHPTPSSITSEEVMQ
jgi:hypothetical protein